MPAGASVTLPVANSVLADFVPRMYRHLLTEALALPTPPERRATCDRCAMCAPDGSSAPSPAYYAPDAKCCTFHPTLPPYAVGGILLSRDPRDAEGRARLIERIDSRIGVTPFGILPPPKTVVLQRVGGLGFGRAQALLCPYFDRAEASCTVWSHRDAVCSTWFCKHERGRDGLDFWRELRRYLARVESVLSAHALHELGWDAERLAAGPPATTELDASALDDAPPSDAAYAALWGSWVGRERELYEETYRKVAALDADAFERLGGLELRLALERLQARHRAMTDPTLPDPLVKNPGMRIERAPDGAVVVTAYVASDPIRLRKAVWDALDHFDGHAANEAVMDAIAAAAGFRFSRELLRGLYHHRILVGPAEARATAPHAGR